MNKNIRKVNVQEVEAKAKNICTALFYEMSKAGINVVDYADTDILPISTIYTMKKREGKGTFLNVAKLADSLGFELVLRKKK